MNNLHSGSRAASREVVHPKNGTYFPSKLPSSLLFNGCLFSGGFANSRTIFPGVATGANGSGRNSCCGVKLTSQRGFLEFFNFFSWSSPKNRRATSSVFPRKARKVEPGKMSFKICRSSKEIVPFSHTRTKTAIPDFDFYPWYHRQLIARFACPWLRLVTKPPWNWSHGDLAVDRQFSWNSWRHTAGVGRRY